MSDHSITPAESPDEQTLLYAESLARLIRAETVSGPGTSGDPKFHAFRGLLKEMYPALFARAEEVGFAAAPVQMALVIVIKGTIGTNKV